ncbi:MAG: trehalase family glycosidase, partial [Terracidiphilus sp.]
MQPSLKSAFKCSFPAPRASSGLRTALVSALLISLACAPAAAPVPAAAQLRSQSVVPLAPGSDVTRDPALRQRLLSLNHDILTRGLHTFPGSQEKLITGYSYGEFFDWDLYFENVYLSYYGVSQYDFSNLQMFLNRQKPDGFISRTLNVNTPRPTQMFKPFLAQLSVLGSRQRGDNFEWLRDGDYQRLQKYLQRWFEYDGDHNGLPVWNSSDASGMDNQQSRSGDLESYSDEGVDLACYLYRELQAMAVIAGKLGKKEDQVKYTAHAKRLAKIINDVFWDEKDGFYYDRNEKTGKQIHIKSIAGFIPLYVGIATPRQARRLIQEHLLNPKEFWLTYPIATYAKTEPDFYNGSHNECNWRGSAWITTNYMVFHGLLRYGYRKEAKELANKTLELALKRNPVTREYYNSETGEGMGMNPFWGWSSLAYIMPLEYELNYDPTDLNKPVRPIVTENYG